MSRHRVRSDTGLVVSSVAAVVVTIGLLCLGVQVEPADAAPIAPISTECGGGQ